MSHRTNTETRLGFLRRYPFDLAVVSLAAVLSYLVAVSFDAGTLPRLLVMFPLALFLPGYAFVSVLFPAGERPARQTAPVATDRRPRGVDGTERLGLAFALSLAIGPVLVIALPLAGWGLETATIAGGLAVVAVVLAQLGVVRRLQTPERERFSVSLRSPLERLRGTESRAAVLSSVVLTLAIGLAVGALLFAFLMPASTGGYDQLSIYSENEDGELVAGEFPDEVSPGESVPVTIAIENGDDADREYTIVIQEQVVENGEVVERTELGEIDASISAGSTGTGDQEITPAAESGETVRISVLLFEGEPPTEPTNENADEDTYFWVTVTDDSDPESAE
ncbi:DUF1616 domain-containing protein [Natronococcus wangiae]|uniref:DUF1616 domain-containing protein n=1 Tax=Natronococcus wangiae TaxID=3068275 RepID=UPI00273F06CC|nr:DUF1616 domain-containing protein [Natronococcus sp. AD5]